MLYPKWIPGNHMPSGPVVDLAGLTIAGTSCGDVEFYRTYTLDYHDGERYPLLERDQAKPDLLMQIIKPLTLPKQLPSK